MTRGPRGIFRVKLFFMWKRKKLKQRLNAAAKQRRKERRAWRKHGVATVLVKR